MNFLNIFKKDKKENNKINVLSSKNNKNFYTDLTSINNVEGFYNFLKKLPNPDSVLKTTGRGIECLRSIANTGQVATCLTSRKAGVTSLNWRLIHQNEKYKDFYDSVFKHIDIYNFISDILNAPLYGYQPIEIVWAKAGEYVIPDKIIAKPQEWFFFTSDGKLGFKQKGNPDGLILSTLEKKFLCPKHEASYINPYGAAILSRCFWDIAFIKGGFEFWTKFLEKYGMPYLLGKYEEGTSDEKKEELLELLANMVQDAVAVIPNNSTLEIKEASGKAASSDIYERYIKVCENNISKNILGQTLTTDVGQNGSYAVGKVHANVRADIVASDARMVEKEINKLLSWIHEINFGDEDIPEFEFWEDKGVGKDIADRDKVLVESGIRFTKKYFLKTYNFAEDDIEIAENSNNVENDVNNFAESSNDDPFETLDEILDTFSDDDFENIISEKITPIIKEFSEIKDPQAAMDKLADVYPKMSSKELEGTLTKCIFFADLLGRNGR